MADSDTATPYGERQPHVFTLRLWPEDLGDGRVDWRGKIQHLNSGEVRYFRDWPALEAFLDELLRGREGDR
ncbi:MAG TPA: hypothetical protein PKO09_03120 [Anaerolineae bacterium]|nr:hypothetical protein [Anaerolineae bacterium]